MEMAPKIGIRKIETKIGPNPCPSNEKSDQIKKISKRTTKKTWISFLWCAQGANLLEWPTSSINEMHAKRGKRIMAANVIFSLVPPYVNSYQIRKISVIMTAITVRTAIT